MRFFVLAAAALLFLSGCTEVRYASYLTKQILPKNDPVVGAGGKFKVGNPYKINGRWYYPKEQYSLVETGIASWYGPGFHGKQTANGEIFDQNELTAAHRTLQMPSLVRVTNLDNGRSLIVRVNDRGPYKRGRIIDLSSKAADLIGMKAKGTAKVRVEVLKEESLKVAQIAKQGRSTKGYEIAMNGRQAPVLTPAYQSAPQRQPSYQQPPSSYQTASLQPQPVVREALVSPAAGPQPLQKMIPGHTRAGEFYPDPLITEMPVTPSRIYVQAGAFSVQDNAYRLRDNLQNFSPGEVSPTTVSGRQLYRVRLGPVETVAQADALLARLANNGHGDAMIVVE